MKISIQMFLILNVILSFNTKNNISSQNLSVSKLKVINLIKDTNKIIKLDRFSSLPKEIEGCGCYFYKSEKDRHAEKYIFVNDFAKVAYVSINNKLQKFILKENKNKSIFFLYTNGQYDLFIEDYKKLKHNDEGDNVTGKLKLLLNSKVLFETKFIGYCGC